MTDVLDHLVPSIQAGDPDAFVRWVAGAEPALRGRLRSFARTVDTEAVVQECLLRVWQVAPRFEPDGRPDGLLRLAATIARNLAITEVRRRRVRTVDLEQIEREAVDVAVDPVLPDPLLRERIEDCRDRLPLKPRSALDARLEGGSRPDAQVAAGIGMTLNTFLQNIRRARLHLVECLERSGITIGGDS